MRFNEGFFALPVWEAYIWRGLFSEFYTIFFISILNELLVVANDSFPNKKVFLRKVRPRRLADRLRKQTTFCDATTSPRNHI